MPMNRSLYPPDWEAISLFVRVDRAHHQCECTGECGLHLPTGFASSHTPKSMIQPRRCREINKQRAQFFNGRVILTAAHTCNCYPICGNVEHILAMCQRCHLRFDIFRHRDSRLRTMASSNWKSQRYRRAGKQFGIEDLNLLVNLPGKKRRRKWINPL